MHNKYNLQQSDSDIIYSVFGEMYTKPYNHVTIYNNALATRIMNLFPYDMHVLYVWTKIELNKVKIKTKW